MIASRQWFPRLLLLAGLLVLAASSTAVAQGPLYQLRQDGHDFAFHGHDLHGRPSMPRMGDARQ